MILYEILFRRYGIRKPEHLMAPVIGTLDKFEFPRNSLWHSLASDGVRSGPAADEYTLRTVTKTILMDHVLVLATDKGTPKKINANATPYIREYHVRNRRFRWMQHLMDVPRDEATLLVENYGFLPKMYRYIRSMYTEYYKWWNLQTTLWAEAEAIAAVSNRQQFVFVSIPRILPSVTTLNKFAAGVTSQTIKVFDTPESLFLLELWKWLGEDHREESTLANLSQNALSKINLVYQEGNNWVLINLGLLNSWRFVTGAEEDTTQKVKVESSQLQKRFLRLMMSLMNTRVMPVEMEGEVTPSETGITVADAPVEQALDDETRLEKAQRNLNTLDDDLEELKTIENNRELSLTEEKPVRAPGVIDVSDFHTEETADGSIVSICDRLAEDGLLTASVYRNLVQSSQNYKTIAAPDGKSTLEEFIKVAPETIKMDESPAIDDITTVTDKSMLSSSLLAFDERYVQKVLAKDVAGMVVNVQKAGVVLSNYAVEKVDDILGNYEIHTLRVRPVEGVASTIRFKLPAVDADGVVTYNGNKYRMRKQRGDLPIRKINPSTVALTSYYGKTFVSRSPKRVNNYAGWLTAQVMSKGLDANDRDVTDLATADLFDNHFKCPRLYSTLAMSFKSFKAGGYRFNFDHTKREEIFGAELMTKYEKDGLILIGLNDSGSYLAVDNNDAIFELNGNNQNLKGTFESLLNIDTTNAPVEFSEVKIFGKNISVGFILGYQTGLTKLMALLKVEPRRVPAGQRIGLENHEYVLTFSDMSLVFSKDDKLATMIIAGFNEYSKALRKYTVAALDHHNVYLNILESAGLGARYLREIDLFTSLFVDPITRELLVEMGEPTTVRGLLVRSSELLLADKHPDQLDLRYMRIKGYERLAGAAYAELVQSIRAHNSRAGKQTRPLELHPYAVWKRIVQDPSLNMVSDINPIQNLKEMEAVTYSGIGGRSARSMTKATREYHETDTGVISESTVDSSHVGVNIYTSADPQFKSLRGTTRDYVPGKTGATALLSTSALLSPGSDHDDPKRVNFVAIQHGHGIACKGYKQGSVRTGYEQVMAHRTSDLFAYTARQDGKVISKSDNGMQIEYADGTVKGIEIGRRFGNAAGLVIPHNVVSDLEVGATFKRGEIISYNDGFFERDMLNPKQVIWKVGITVKTVLLESNQTLEDASSISKKTAELLTTRTTKVKTVKVTFDQILKNVVKSNQAVEPESILCIIEDPVTSNSNLFDEESLNTLKLLSNQAPTSKVRGTVERIEVFYHGEKEDMSESLRTLCNSFDRELSARSRAAGRGSVNGSVNGDLRIDGEPLAIDTAAIRFYITGDVAAGVGDKGVFANQMKTVFSEVLPNEMKTESGEEIGAVFGQKSIADRIVLSPELIGTTGTLLDVIGKKAAAIYKRK